MAKNQGQYERGYLTLQISARHPNPGEGLTLHEGNLTLGHAYLYRANFIGHAIKYIEKLPGRVLSQEKFVYTHYALLIHYKN
jgi:hypothetical protein